jgi:hypothetical protein
VSNFWGSKPNEIKENSAGLKAAKEKKFKENLKKYRFKVNPVIFFSYGG